MGRGSHQCTRYSTQTHAVVSPAAAQLIQTLTTISNPLPPPASLAPPSPGIAQRRWALTSSAVGREPAAGAETGERTKGKARNLRGGFIAEERKKVDVKRQGKEEKVEGRLVGVTYHIVYHIQKSQVCLSSWRLR